MKGKHGKKKKKRLSILLRLSKRKNLLKNRDGMKEGNSTPSLLKEAENRPKRCGSYLEIELRGGKMFEREGTRMRRKG